MEEEYLLLQEDNLHSNKLRLKPLRTVQRAIKELIFTFQ